MRARQLLRRVGEALRLDDDSSRFSVESPRCRHSSWIPGLESWGVKHDSPRLELESSRRTRESPELDLESPKLGRASSRFTRDALNLAIDSPNLDLDSSRCARDPPKFDGESVSLANNHQRPNVQASGPTRELAGATNALAGHRNVQPIFHGLRIELDLKGQAHAPLLPEESPDDST